MNSLATKIVRAIRDIDHEPLDGGLYALPDRYSKGKRPAGHHHVFGGAYKELDLFSRLGMKGREQGCKRIAFHTEEGAGYVEFADIALTKVRSYGSGFQLDRHHGKKWEDCSADLKKSVSRLIKESRTPRSPRIGILVALVFADSERHAKALVAPATDESFVTRHNLTLAHDTWADPHGRGIWTSVLCWLSRNSPT